MDTREIEIIQGSYKSIQQAMPRVVRVLFDRLFEVHPELRPLFRADMRDSRKKFVRKVDYIINHLDEPEILGPELKKLGRFHGDKFHIDEKRYQMFIDASIYALSAAFGNDFTPELRRTWAYVLEILAQVMQSGVKSTNT